MHNILKALAAAVLLAGCGSSTVSLTARAASGGAGQALTVSGGINLTRVRMVIQKIELERESNLDTGTAGADGAHREGEQELAVGPFLLDLQGTQLDGGVSTVFTVRADPGTYHELTFKIHKLEDAEAGANPAFSDLRGLSIRIEGTRNGAPFTFDSALDEEQEREGDFTIKTGDNNIAFNIDPSGWFMDGTTPLDPSDPSARSKIERNIKASIDIFEDDDHLGRRH